MSKKGKGNSKRIQGKGLKNALARHIQAENVKSKKQKTLEDKNSVTSISKRKNILDGRGYVPFDENTYLLLVGEGDFSFATSLISHNYIEGNKLIATGYDEKEESYQKYPSAQENISFLESHGIKVLHKIDATKLETCLKLHNLKKKKDAAVNNYRRINCIMFNFPHSGKGIKDVERNIRDHQLLVSNYLKSSINTFDIIAANDDNIYNKHGASPGIKTVILTVFEGEPYDSWNVKGLAKSLGFKVVRSSFFDWTLYPEYHHRRTNSMKDTTKPAHERNARMYIFTKDDISEGILLNNQPLDDE